MININVLYIFLLLIVLIVILILGSIDFHKKRKVKEYPFISFLIPCYNDGDTVENTIISIHDSYDPKMLEIIVVDDKSKDDSLVNLKKLQKKYSFKLIENKKNLGKSHSLNNIVKFAKHDFFFFVDADITLNKKSVNDLLARIQTRPKMMAVGAPYTTKNKGFIPSMQVLFFNMLALLQASYNLTSTISLWGGCILVKRKAFEKVKGFSINMVCEDLDLAFKINEQGWKVEQSFYPVNTYVPKNFKIWAKQQLRWVTGGVQVVLKHFKTWISHPIQAFFIVMFSIITFFSALFLFKEILLLKNIINSFQFLSNMVGYLLSFKILGVYYMRDFFRGIIINSSFLLLSLPYVFPSINEWKEWYKVFYVIPFAIIFYPIFMLLAFIGLWKGIRAYFKYKEGERAW